MIAIVCVDDNRGMMFNNRRQSKDAALIKKVMEITKGKTLWIGSYSFTLFHDSDNIIVDDKFLSKASVGEYCFIETEDLMPYEGKFESIIVH